MAEKQTQTTRIYPSDKLIHSLPRFVVLGLTPDGFDTELQEALLEHGVGSCSIDKGRLVDRIDGVFFGRESAFDNSKPGILSKTLGRLGLIGNASTESESIPLGVIAFPTIKSDKGEINTPAEQIEALCLENIVPVVFVDTATTQSASQIVEQLLAASMEK